MKTVQFLDGIALFKEMTQEEAQEFIDKMMTAFESVEHVILSDVIILSSLPDKNGSKEQCDEQTKLATS